MKSPFEISKFAKSSNRKTTLYRSAGRSNQLGRPVFRLDPGFPPCEAPNLRP